MPENRGFASFLKAFQPSPEALRDLESSSSRADAVPFADAFAPMRQYAIAESQMAEDLADALVEELSRSFSQTLLSRFVESRDYVAFIRSLWAGDWIELFTEYPVMARLAEQTVALKIDEAREFAARLEADLPTLRQFFQTDFDHVVSVCSGMSDPHRGLRSVKVVQFASGARLVYKPKDLALDVAWSGLLDWVNDRAPVQLMSARVLNRGTHGWTEFIPHVPAADVDGIRRFYRRAGVLAGVLYAIRATDCHFENLIACGDQPVLVDTETLMQPEVAGEGVPAASVLQSGLLPCRDIANGGELVPCGGLDDTGRRSTATRPSWQHVNTNRMTFGGRKRVEFSSTNVPALEGNQIAAGPFMCEVVEGFRESYRILMEHGEAFTSPEGPLAPFRGASTRFILRNTRVYSLLLRCATLPQFLRDENDYRDRIRTLLGRVGATNVARVAGIVEAEAEALAGLDVPMFTTQTDSTSLFTDSRTELPGVITACGYDAVVNQVRGFSDEDLSRQISLVHHAFGESSAS